MLKIKVKDAGLRELQEKLQTSDADMYVSMVLRGTEAVRSIEDKLRSRFPKREPALRIEWDISSFGLSVKLIAPNEGLLQSVREVASEIIRQELDEMATKMQKDLGRGVFGAGL